MNLPSEHLGRDGVGANLKASVPKRVSILAAHRAGHFTDAFVAFIKLDRPFFVTGTINTYHFTPDNSQRLPRSSLGPSGAAS